MGEQVFQDGLDNLLFLRPQWSGEETARAVRLRLTHTERAKARLAAMLPDGTAVAIVLPDRQRGSTLRDGTVLTGDAGVLAIVDAVPEPVTRVNAATPLLLRAVYHLANRHVPTQLAADHLLIERNPVLEHMLVTLGAGIEHVELPFDPEPGAYDGHAHAGGHRHASETDAASASIGEQLSISAHARSQR